MHAMVMSGRPATITGTVARTYGMAAIGFASVRATTGSRPHGRRMAIAGAMRRGIGRAEQQRCSEIDENRLSKKGRFFLRRLFDSAEKKNGPLGKAGRFL